MATDAVLVKIDKAKAYLAAIVSIEDVMEVMGMAEAAKAYAKRVGSTVETINYATEVRLRAERKLGEILSKTPKQSGARGRKGGGTRGSQKEPQVDEPPTLADAGISKKLSSQSQELAKASDDEFEAALDTGAKELNRNKVLKDLKSKKTAKKRNKVADAGKKIKPSDRWHVYRDDMQTWTAPRQYDYIITDPPYKKEFLPLWSVLAERATEWLKDGGLLVAMSGQSYLDQVYSLLSEHLTYYWTAAYLTPGQPKPLRQVNVNTTWKPLLIFKKGKYKGKIFGDVFTSEKNEKDMHDWGQSESGMYNIVSKICLSGQYILDPFCGAGTTGVAAIRHGCLFTGVEIDTDNVKISKARINDTTKE